MYILSEGGHLVLTQKQQLLVPHLVSEHEVAQQTNI